MHEIKVNKEIIVLVENKYKYNGPNEPTPHEFITKEAVQVFMDVKVYVGDPWYEPADGKIRNLTVETKISEEDAKGKNRFK